MGRLEEQDFDEKRLARRQRRKKNQLIAFISLFTFFAIIVILVCFGIGAIKKVIGEKKALQEQAALEASIENENVVIETPSDVEEEPVEMSESDVLEEIVNGCLNELTLEDKVAGLFMVTPEQLTGVETVVKAGSSTQDALSRYSVCGLVYSPKNLKSQEQVSEMIKSTRDMSKYPIFVALKEDGSSEGTISASLGGLDIPEINNSDTAYSAGTNIAAAMFKYGFNFDLAPSVDVSENGKYGTDVALVSDVTVSFTNALSDGGIFACLYDFPASTSDSEITKDELMAGNYSVYQKTIGDGSVSAVMMSNGSFPGLVSVDTPASLSYEIIGGELRNSVGFDGVVITGPLDQEAITSKYSSAEAAVSAIAAGADIIYLPENFEEAYQGVLDAVSNGKITEERIDESLKRIYRLKYADKVGQTN
ncbi:glycoside hydrolase family 3 N-terminal domain-containing protein [Butyrivibrio sp. XBB1001]|uniref:glycoside hydrolase family 3 N-terminal domain-containing protein n=1 Tax=Butyrivibrio sp. XBB1001 TaxID=1280682 RepID=UPI00041D8948|nr:glycoside hydrolase family 3 N-terminal domain-containing protein [Butyrivibrio sp. XBB1001]